MLSIKEKTYYLTEIEAESQNYEEAGEYIKELQNKGFVVDLVSGFKKNDEKNRVYFITAFKKTLF